MISINHSPKETSLDSFLVAGYMMRTTHKNNQYQKDLEALWGRFMGENQLATIPHRIDQSIISVYYEYAFDGPKTSENISYNCMIGAKVSSIDNLPKGITGIKIPSSHYKVFPVTGEFPEAIMQAWIKIWQTPLNRTLAYDFE